MSQKSIQIDQEGYPLTDDIPISDADYGRELLSNLCVRDTLTFTKSGSEELLVHAFDAPLVVHEVDEGEGTLWTLHMPYDYSLPFDLKNLRLDNFDRFCGRFDNGVPFVFSRDAQDEFFDLLEDFTDDTITVAGVTIAIESKYKNSDKISSQDFWTDRYKTNDTPWDLTGPTPVLKQALLQLKLPRQRVLVLGAGVGHDAVEFATVGHVVTAVDFSEQAHQEHIKKYGNVKDLTYVVADAFKLPASYNQQFDVVFDHTFFCAIEPMRRREAVQLWKRVLAPRGHLLSIFFVMDKDEGPPFGATEWELHELLRKDFSLLFWTRTNVSVPRRKDKELLVYASKNS